MEQVIRKSAALHLTTLPSGILLKKVLPDPWTLDIGWLINLNSFQTFGSNGDAVAIGLAVDLLYSARIGLVKEATGHQPDRLGFSTYDAILHQVDKDNMSVILKGLDEFREHLVVSSPLL